MKPAPKTLQSETDADLLQISLRAYVPMKDSRPPKFERHRDQGPSEYTLVFDTETTTTAPQSLRFGVFQVRKGEELFSAGCIFQS